MVENPAKTIHIHPAGTGKITDWEKAVMLKNSAPTAYRIAQDVLMAARKYVNKSGLFSTEKSRLQKFQSECYELARALEYDGFMSSEIAQKGKTFVFIEFFCLFSDAFPNWQKEYEALNWLVPRIF